ncbi:NAD(P)H-quinone dehydrogenase [Brachybacterium sp. MASK1Z-5]|uniref:NAD(P)H-quinone dehydrogenase n=1 Tax=Brachybacterium halotolerans TaxID=2795215 RepID=A0ABS1BDR1_9MICO|nr:NAD(P)H-quinone dehydrogenase [Brachybacterium halotolerans]MBK0332140.1 NAD(P)H-quinone dehydrogenase [Brachybacterium halotolerans]
MADPSTALPPDPDRTGADGGAEPRVVIIGGGPGGYEAALTAARTGARVTLVEERGIGGAAVLTDVVPSKSLVATADVLDLVGASAGLGIRDAEDAGEPVAGSLTVDLARVNERLRALARAQSEDIAASLAASGVVVRAGRGRLEDAEHVAVLSADGEVVEVLPADVVLLSVGARPRELPEGRPDGERILSWTQLYELDELPSHLIVVGSGVTGAEFASAYRALGSEVTLVSSRDQVLPGGDEDAAAVLEEAFTRRGVTLCSRSRAASARRERVADGDGADGGDDGDGSGEGVVVTLEDGREIRGSHVLMALGAVPATTGLGLEEAGVRLRPSGHIDTDRVSRTSVRGVYAAGDCTGVHPLASVAAMQGRIAMHHALGDAVSPLIHQQVSSAVFTSPEIAMVGLGARELADGADGEVHVLPLATNPRAKMQGLTAGFVKLVVRPGSGTVMGGVVVAPRASELIHPITLAVAQRMTADELASAFTVYPSLTGSIAEAARRPAAAE